MPRIRPRTVLVTGAARRLGRGIAIDLARAGWQVAVHYRRSTSEAIETIAACARHTCGSAGFHADFEDESAVRALVPQVVERFGRLDAVVNNASLFEQDSAADFSFASMERHLRGNTGAPILLAQALAAHVAERDSEIHSNSDTDPDSDTHIDAAADPTTAAQPATTNTTDAVVVNLLDQKLWNQNPDFISYTLSKAALEAATTMLALALAPRVRVVGVAPGLTLTSHLLGDERFAQLHRLSPLGRSSTPEDVAATVRFALENRSITGTSLLVDGGQHLMKFERDFSLM